MSKFNRKSKVATVENNESIPSEVVAPSSGFAAVAEALHGLTDAEVRELANVGRHLLRARRLQRKPVGLPVGSKVTWMVLYTVAYATGLRAGELAGLTWTDVVWDCEHPHLRVARQRQWDKSGALTKEPKKKSSRVVPLHPRAAAALQHLDRGGWVFPGPTSNWAKTLRDDMQRAGLQTNVEGGRVTFHALRRSFMSALSLAGVPENEIGHLAGHGASSTAGRHYIAKHLSKYSAIVGRLPW